MLDLMRAILILGILVALIAPSIAGAPGDEEINTGEPRFVRPLSPPQSIRPQAPPAPVQSDLAPEATTIAEPPFRHQRATEACVVHIPSQVGDIERRTGHPGPCNMERDEVQSDPPQVEKPEEIIAPVVPPAPPPEKPELCKHDCKPIKLH